MEMTKNNTESEKYLCHLKCWIVSKAAETTLELTSMKVLKKLILIKSTKNTSD